MSALKIIIAGRPNVGKSTLFNRLIGKKVSIVDYVPGTTRDYKKAALNIGSVPCMLFDTAGIDTSSRNVLNRAVTSKTKLLLDSADIILFMMDAKVGLTAHDIEFAEYLRKFKTKIFLVSNKMEAKASEAGYWDAFSLGIESPISISASHGLGITDLLQSIELHIQTKNAISCPALRKNGMDLADLNNASEETSLDGSCATSDLNQVRKIKLAIIGRPNVGKSTLFNSILGEPRVITSPESGTTTDPIEVTTNWLDDTFQIVDTAGIRRAGKIHKGLEEFSVWKAFEVIKYAEIVLMILDNERALDAQDLRIINYVSKEGRGLVLAINKWDRETNKRKKLARLKEKILSSLPQFQDLPIITISALKNKGIETLKKGILDSHKNWINRIPTARLNQWLTFKLSDHPPPMVRGRRIKLKYMTQVKARPPTFVLFSSQKCEVSESYKRYLVNGIRKDFKLYGVPIRLSIRVGDNPYGNKNNK
tara:strand:- start:97 stop:1533 length:1437 start_codon:yes stop_codon:yes gene_type:complete